MNTNGHLISRRSTPSFVRNLGDLAGRRAHSKSNSFMVPWTPSKSLDLHTHICPPFPYPMAVGKHHEHKGPPHLPSQHPIVCLKSGRSGSRGHSKSNVFMVPWTPSKSIDLLTHICPPFPYPMAVGKHHEHQGPPHLPPQHPIDCLKSGRDA